MVHLPKEELGLTTFSHSYDLWDSLGGPFTSEVCLKRLFARFNENEPLIVNLILIPLFEASSVPSLSVSMESLSLAPA